MTTLANVEQVLDRLPIFPLPTAVLLPYEVLPLHVFEPRYRELTRDVLETHGMLAIAQLAPGWEGRYEERPLVEPVCGAGMIIRHEKLPDGRYNLLLKGLARVRILSEHPPLKLYREVRAELALDAAVEGGEGRLADACDRVRRMLFALCSARPGPGANALAQLASKAENATSLADIVAAALFTDPRLRHKAIVTLDPAERLKLAEGAIAELLVAPAPAGKSSGLRN